MKKRLLAVLVSLGVVTAFSGLLKDEGMSAGAAERTLNLVTTFGTSETSQYGVPSAFIGRFNVVTQEVSDFYSSEFGISVNFSKPASNYVVWSPADTCRRSTTPDALCSHASNSQCTNTGPYHHTNCGYMLSELYPDGRELVYGLELHFTAVKLCAVESKFGEHIVVNGVTDCNEGTIIVRDMDYTMGNYNVQNWLGDTFHNAGVVAVTAHEIGHLYGIKDHYDASNTKNDMCIWGHYSYTHNVMDQLLICDDCRATIQANARKYNF